MRRGVPIAGALCLASLALALGGCGSRDEPPPPTATPTVADVLQIVTPTPGTAAAPPTRAADSRYVVQAGDSLSDIAAEFDVTLEALQQANGIDDPDSIYAGQVLIIPESK